MYICNVKLKLGIMEYKDKYNWSGFFLVIILLFVGVVYSNLLRETYIRGYNDGVEETVDTIKKMLKAETEKRDLELDEYEKRFIDSLTETKRWQKIN